MRIAFSIIACALLVCCAIQSPQAGPVGFRLSSGFKPSQIPGLQLWLDASQITGLNDGDSVATWNDNSGNSYNVTQAIASKRPTYKTSAINSLPVVRFDGVDDDLDRSAVTFAQPNTLFVVLKTTAAANITMVPFTGIGANENAIYTPGGKWAAYGGTALTSVVSYDSNANLLCGVINGASSQLRLNQTQIASGNSGASTFSLVRVGSNTVSFWLGDICELIIYNAELSASNILTLENYLRTKWGTP